ncbi:hypothetical protein NDU88_006544 [Pleurodeles waltl]|uniref:Uncharacterized protein n=1 Tax=Pleurodeles waltl TaxID=8319 RepID=A0AAV7WXW9_PLEWA|nr:hypothetical protein NDU88_006544 [Pleurodeles waltl]
MVTTSRGRRHVTRNVLWFQRVEPWEMDPEARLQDEKGEELNGGGHSQQRSPDGCRQGGEGFPRRDQLMSCSPNPETKRGQELTGRSERYNLRPNPNPSQRLKDFMC